MTQIYTDSNQAAAKRRKRHKEEGFFFLRFLCLFVAIGFLGCANVYSATSDYAKILGNMGGVGFDGLPRLSFNIVDKQDAGELDALGFEFQLTHRIKLRQSRTAETEWSLPCPRTCAYIDTQGNIIWFPPNGQAVRFQKNGQVYDSANNGASATISPDGGMIEITTSAALKWRYRNGFLENISSRGGYYSVTTDREVILSISKRILNREIFLLKCAYSKQGDLEELEFAGGRKYWLQWTANHALAAIDNPAGRLFDFEYTNSLLTCWTKTNGPRHELKWQYYLDNVRTTAFQTPPVLLREDAAYVYSWDKSGSVDIVTIYNKVGALVSRTKIGAAGVEQTTPKGKIEYAFE